MRLSFFSIVILFLLFLLSCSSNKPADASDNKAGADTAEVYDLNDIEENGELIAVTISGPESYFQYHNLDMGLEYMLAEDFANKQGFAIRMEIAKDTMELFDMLRNNKADLIAYELPVKLIKKMGFLCVGVVSDTANASWAVRKSSPLLAESLDEWYSPALRVEQQKTMRNIMSRPRIHHSASLKPRAAMRKGSISPYDGLLARAASTLGWDWRLLAAQCYQESAFDPEAVSWAGARGLMQIMPGTARQLGVSVESLFQPETNIVASAKYLKMLQGQFSDIKNPAERTKFVLAAYNGGTNHIRDAMALAKKHRRNYQLWANVSYFVLHLSEPAFYKDPVVKSGYMIGSETYRYVASIMARWQQYITGVRAKPVLLPDASGMSAVNSFPAKSRKKNRFTNTSTQIISRSDSIFQIK